MVSFKTLFKIKGFMALFAGLALAMLAAPALGQTQWPDWPTDDEWMPVTRDDIPLGDPC